MRTKRRKKGREGRKTDSEAGRVGGSEEREKPRRSESENESIVRIACLRKGALRTEEK